MAVNIIYILGLSSYIFSHYFPHLALGRGRLSSKYLLDGSDSESDNENKNEDDTDGNMPSKNFAILLVEKFIYEDSDKNFYLDEALKHKGSCLAFSLYHCIFCLQYSALR